MKHISVHGVGQFNPRYIDEWELDKHLKEYNIAGASACFWYQETLQNSNINFLGKIILKTAKTLLTGKLALLAKIPTAKAEAYIFDVLVMALDVRIRESVGGAFKNFLDNVTLKDEPITLWCHSQGTIFAWWFIKKYPEYASRINLVFMASPFGSKLCGPVVRWVYKKLTKSINDYDTSKVKTLYTGWSLLDVISGPIYGMGNLRNSKANTILHSNVSKYIELVLKDNPSFF